MDEGTIAATSFNAPQQQSCQPFSPSSIPFFIQPGAASSFDDARAPHFLDCPSSVSFFCPTWCSQDLSCFSRGHREVPIQYLCNMSQQLAATKKRKQGIGFITSFFPNEGWEHDKEASS
jgi:hypothetical protein